jgi:Tol biopolymer transport system component
MISLPAWAPDGRSLFVAVNGRPESAAQAGRQLEVVRVDLAGAVQPLLQDALDPALSPDGGQLAYLRPSPDGATLSLELADSATLKARTLLDGTQFRGLYAPRFAPDGRRIVFAAIDAPQTEDGSDLPVQSRAAPAQGLLALFEPPVAEAHGPPWDLWELQLDGSGLRRLTSFYEDLPMAAFSPDGRQIAVMGLGGIYLMDADGSNLRQLDFYGDHGGLDWADPVAN